MRTFLTINNQFLPHLVWSACHLINDVDSKDRKYDFDENERDWICAMCQLWCNYLMTKTIPNQQNFDHVLQYCLSNPSAWFITIVPQIIEHQDIREKQLNAELAKEEQKKRELLSTESSTSEKKKRTKKPKNIGIKPQSLQSPIYKQFLALLEELSQNRPNTDHKDQKDYKKDISNITPSQICLVENWSPSPLGVQTWNRTMGYSQPSTSRSKENIQQQSHDSTAKDTPEVFPPRREKSKRIKKQMDGN